MDLNFLSGLLLIIAVLAILAYVIKELVGDRIGDLKKVRQSVAHTLAGHLRSDAKPINDHLVGSMGKVIAHSADGARPMRIRLGFEVWPARLDSAPESRLPVGTPVKVTAVDGPIAIVVAGS